MSRLASEEQTDNSEYYHGSLGQYHSLNDDSPQRGTTLTSILRSLTRRQCFMISLILAFVVCSLTIGVALVSRTRNGAGESDEHNLPIADSLKSSSVSYNYCDSATFNVTCSDDEVVVIETAIFRRSSSCDSVTKDCQHDVVDLIDVRCSGRSNCRIELNGTIFNQLPPCPNAPHVNLKVGYRCQKVMTVNPPTCGKDGVVRTRGTSNFLSNFITERNSYGSSRCPWRIEAAPGQQINLTLFDFGAQAVNQTDPCYVYATVRDGVGETAAEFKICSGETREQDVYLSQSHVIDVVIRNSTGNTDKSPYFLLGFEVIGCPDMVAPTDGWVMRHTNEISIVGCFKNGVQIMPRFVQCDARNRTWNHGFLNCSELGQGRNLALNRPAFQSSTHTHHGVVLSASLAVDGSYINEIDDPRNPISCSHTWDYAGGPNWLVVDLGQPYHIYRIVLANRRGCCANRMDYFIVGVTNATLSATNPPRRGAYPLCGQYPTRAAEGANLTLTCDPDTLPGRYVIVQQPINGLGFLTICELEVYAYEDG